MAEPARVSVALCTHNGARYLADQLHSIAQQSRPVDELLVSDDDSTDTTVDLVEDFAERSADRANVSVTVNRPALGVTKNFESVLARATGDVVLLSDQDDVWDPDKARVLAARLDPARAQLVFTDATIVDGAGVSADETLFGNLRVSEAELAAVESGRAAETLLRRNIVTGATAGMTRRLIELALPIPESWVHDEWLAVSAAFLGDVLVDRRALTSYRLHGANEIGATRLGARAALGRLTESRSGRNARLLERARALAERYGDHPAVRPDLREAVRAKLAHEEVRSAYPASRLRRVRPVLAQLRSGSYARFGLGAQDVLRDLVQPV
ncbi:glycosyltransferase [Leifsonia sp. C5G2]|uniref:glycosyltransferase n=1 Tax=Leifsonia sp. C5G2 TaxID=2735269 RepID=UPI0015855B8D|nr:glycosyltransferase [Leifsonia sp. C5G2]NUU04759.1 glycosyltransferase [Leifsonia sp. C5G2]